ncbi:MAG: hypothetical protein KKF89_06070, partial [Nanoarchaeota archaeon]|nr:hypothetical protein [Nanoarchaeota archaeon]
MRLKKKILFLILLLVVANYVSAYHYGYVPYKYKKISTVENTTMYAITCEDQLVKLLVLKDFELNFEDEKETLEAESYLIINENKMYIGVGRFLNFHMNIGCYNEKKKVEKFSYDSFMKFFGLNKWQFDKAVSNVEKKTIVEDYNYFPDEIFMPPDALISLDLDIGQPICNFKCTKPTIPNICSLEIITEPKDCFRKTQAINVSVKSHILGPLEIDHIDYQISGDYEVQDTVFCEDCIIYEIPQIKDKVEIIATPYCTNLETSEKVKGLYSYKTINHDKPTVTVELKKDPNIPFWPYNNLKEKKDEIITYYDLICNITVQNLIDELDNDDLVWSIKSTNYKEDLMYEETGSYNILDNKIKKDIKKKV